MATAHELMTAAARYKGKAQLIVLEDSMSSDPSIQRLAKIEIVRRCPGIGFDRNWKEYSI